MIEFLAPEDVGLPLLRVVGMLPAVVLDDQPELLIREVLTPAPAAVAPTKDQIDTGFRKARQHEKQAKPGFLR